MRTTTIAGRSVHVDDDGFLTLYGEWDEDLAEQLAAAAGIELTDEHWRVVRFLREDFRATGETAPLRRVATVGGVPVRTLFALFPQHPARTMAYIAGLPKPHEGAGQATRPRSGAHRPAGHR